MRTNPVLAQRAHFDNYEYGRVGASGKDGPDKDKRKEIDCSHLTHQMLNRAGYEVPYQNTAALRKDSKHYQTISAKNAKPGDLALFSGHVGVLESFNAKTKNGRFFGSQTSTGPASTNFGPGSYWGSPVKFLRVRESLNTNPKPAKKLEVAQHLSTKQPESTQPVQSTQLAQPAQPLKVPAVAPPQPAAVADTSTSFAGIEILKNGSFVFQAHPALASLIRSLF